MKGAYFGYYVDAKSEIEFLQDYMSNLNELLIRGSVGNEKPLPLSLRAIAENRSELYLEHYVPRLYEGFIITFIQYLESQFKTVAKVLKELFDLKLTLNDFSGSMLERFKKYSCDYCPLASELTERDWNDVKGIIEIRNCLIHNGTDLEEYNKSKIIFDFKKRNAVPKIEDNRLKLSNELVMICLEIIDGFIERMYNPIIKHIRV